MRDGSSSEPEVLEGLRHEAVQAQGGSLSPRRSSARPARSRRPHDGSPDESCSNVASRAAIACSASSSLPARAVRGRARAGRFPVSSRKSTLPSSRLSAWRACCSACSSSPVRSAPGQARKRPARRRLAPDLERDREGLLKELAPPRVRRAGSQTPEVVQEPPDVEPVVLLLVERLRPFGVRAREHPVPVPLGDDRRLEVAVSEASRSPSRSASSSAASTSSRAASMSLWRR